MSDKNQSPVANQQYSSQIPASYQSNDIDLREFIRALWEGKFIIITTVIIIVAGAVFFVVKQPNVYKSHASFVLEKDFYGSMNISEPKIVTQFLSSRELRKKMSSEAKVDITLLNGIIVSYDKRDMNISISKTSTEPQAAFDGVSTYSITLNSVLKSIELEKVQASIDSLKSQENVYSLKTKEYLDELLAQQLFKKGLLESPSSKLVIQTREAVKPTSYIKPKRTLIVALGALLGVMLGVAIVLVRFIFRREAD
ncbi:GNVR domain-containing protein [Vibrio sp. TRT 29B02]|uniref:GNVR domain-containing protein n=1 Tax=Vibrio sp. TRT 29B02 TaxID=3418508 RepID=UPI003CEDC3F9